MVSLERHGHVRGRHVSDMYQKLARGHATAYITGFQDCGLVLDWIERRLTPLTEKGNGCP